MSPRTNRSSVICVSSRFSISTSRSPSAYCSQHAIAASIESVSRGTPRQENAQLNEVCSLLDGLNRRGVPRETLSMEAAIACCEQYALGDRLVEMLKREDTQITEDLFVRKKPR